MIWPAGILAVAFAVAVRALLIRHVQWRRGAANVVAFGLWPVLLLVWVFAYGKDQDGLNGGLALFLFLPLALLIGVAAVAAIILWDILRHLTGVVDPSAEEDGEDRM